MSGYTSDLSIDEAILLEEIGFEPLSFVLGSSFFHIGYTLASWSKSEEMPKLTSAMQEARASAMRRLVDQARAVGADGIVGVRMDVDHREHHAEFVVMGTAVKAPSPAWRVDGAPFTSDLSGQDFWALVRAGYRPRSLVVGSCVYHVAHQGLGQWLNKLGNNCEMTNFTQALYDAREIAMERMQAEAERASATGIVGVKVKEGSYGWHSHIIEFLAIGTSIAATGAPGEHEPIAPMLSAS
ncbi:MAG: heavy metal-binding domain-containing protein [Polyangia bacterium]